MKMQALESRMKRAAEQKLQKKRQIVSLAKSLTSKVNECLDRKLKKESDTYLQEFQKNVLKRTELEKRIKKRDEEKLAEREYQSHTKMEKL